MTAPRPLLLLANPAAGGGRGRHAAAAAAQALGARGVRVDLVYTGAAAELAERAGNAAAAGAGMIALAGGDGSVRVAARALAGTPAALALIPAGRGNDLARALGIPPDPAAAAALVVDGVPRAIDLGRAGDDVFATVAAFGFDAEVAARVHRGELPGRGALTYVLAALRTLIAYRPVDAVLTGDFGRIAGRFLLVAAANTCAYGGGMHIAPAARPDDGLLDVCVVAEVGRLEVIRLLAGVRSGGHVRHPAVRIVRTRRLQIESLVERRELYADGEPLAATPVTLEVAPAALRVLVLGERADQGICASS